MDSPLRIFGDQRMNVSDGGQRRLCSVMRTSFKIPAVGILLNPRLDKAA
jgi:hypothetical protein